MIGSVGVSAVQTAPLRFAGPAQAPAAASPAAPTPVSSGAVRVSAADAPQPPEALTALAMRAGAGAVAPVGGVEGFDLFSIIVESADAFSPAGERLGERGPSNARLRGDADQDGGADGRGGAGAATRFDDLTEEEQRAVEQLRERDREVRAHEQAHATVGGQYAGAPSYEYQTGPDGQRYAIGGSVAIDVAPVSGDPQATIQKMLVVEKAALAPAEPSAADRQVASVARATRMDAMAEARSEAQQERLSGADGSAAAAVVAAGAADAEPAAAAPVASPADLAARAAELGANPASAAAEPLRAELARAEISRAGYARAAAALAGAPAPSVTRAA